jgi:sterol desaturase/sphingolipid hydroxylase (fatty acid hydroxylase superfamily)
METLIRLSVAVGIFAVMAVCEVFYPRRTQWLGRRLRWPVNLGLAALNMILMRFTLGAMAYWLAVNSQQYSFGLLHYWVIPEWLAIALTLVLLDMAIYGQHILMHKWPVLWRLHQVHHSDLEFDATTAVRFHPLEIIFSMIYKSAWVTAIGAHPAAVIIFEILLNGAATFNHSNIAIPEAMDKQLRWLIITPDMHRIHHSALPAETDSNYGFSISCWDRLFHTYRAEPKKTQTTLTIGLETFRKPSELGFLALLLLPFKPLRRR